MQAPINIPNATATVVNAAANAGCAEIQLAKAPIILATIPKSGSSAIFKSPIAFWNFTAGLASIFLIIAFNSS
ncbi:hypothetical protein LW858_04745 [Bacillus cereus]|uniref:hypothetical protein n=1 Tax=Bacillus cereus TaxID=1396 RepID=UPI001F22FFD7|nr:hypothetical protein [Bacillus cereus]UIJ67568.1 hypothetical protein LW858_04745 [Bacillus cereus]